MNKLSSEQVTQLKEIGTHLRQRRLELSIPLEQIASSTKIRLGLLRALEDGQVDQLPEPVYLKGLIRRYGKALQIDGSALVKTFAQSSDSASSVASETAPQELSPNRILWRTTGLGFYVLYLLLLVGALCGLFYFLNPPPAEEQLADELVTKEPSPPVVDSPPSTSTSPKTSTSPTPQALEEPAPLSVTVSLEGSSWLTVTIDGQTSYEGILTKGTQRTWKAKKQLSIRAGNAGAVSLSINQEPPQLLGRPGEVKEVNLTQSE
ncbi:MAG: helix-turn-helix domain-containing protein [Xenococcaceae cyanobacterium]